MCRTCGIFYGLVIVIIVIVVVVVVMCDIVIIKNGGETRQGRVRLDEMSRKRCLKIQRDDKGLVGMDGSMRPPGKSGLTFDHILNRLQGKLQKSRKTGAEIHSLNGSINEIHNTLGGTLVSCLFVSLLRSYCLT
jgi:hypothetical protein